MQNTVHFREGWSNKFICGIALFPKGKCYDMKFSRTYHRDSKEVTCKRCKRILKKSFFKFSNVGRKILKRR